MASTDLHFEITLRNEDAREKADQVTLLFDNLSQNREIEDVQLGSPASAPDGTKGIDPVLGAALLVSVAPPLATKLVEFLHDFVLRRDRTTLHIKIQNKKQNVIEIDMPASMKPAEVRKIVSELQKIAGK